ncbi:MAG: glycogen synthase [Hyphomicrobiales bacterium]|nr:glycogen synthase [Hyphomicrobiales bacterium]
MQPPLNVLMTTDAVGGVWTYTIDLAEALCKAGVSVTIAALGPAPSLSQTEQATATGASLRTLDAPLDWLAESEVDVAQASHAIAALARQTGADLIQVHSPALIARARMPTPVVSVIHSCVATWWDAVRGGDMPDDLIWRANLVREGLKRATINIAPSRSLSSAVSCAYAHEPPLVVHNARKPATAAQSAAAPFILSAGRFWDEGKNIATLDQAAPLCTLPVVAAGPLVAPDGAHIAPAHVDARGALTAASLEALLAQRPIFCSTALYEPFGLAVLEAAQAGCALVLSDIPTFRELWADAALFTPPRDASALVGALNALAQDDAGRATLGRAAQERAAQFTPERQARDMIRIYEDALRAARAEAAA